MINLPPPASIQGAVRGVFLQGLDRWFRREAPTRTGPEKPPRTVQPPAAALPLLREYLACVDQTHQHKQVLRAMDEAAAEYDTARQRLQETEDRLNALAVRLRELDPNA